MKMYQFFKWKDIVQAMGLQSLAPMLALKRVAIFQIKKHSRNILKFASPFLQKNYLKVCVTRRHPIWQYLKIDCFVVILATESSKYLH